MDVANHDGIRCLQFRNASYVVRIWLSGRAWAAVGVDYHEEWEAGVGFNANNHQCK